MTRESLVRRKLWSHWRTDGWLAGKNPEGGCMRNSMKIALRNLLRYRRRTFFTLGLIAVGMVFVLVFVSVTAWFKDMMVRNITDSYLGPIQIHAQGYVDSIDMLPLQLNLRPEQVAMIEQALKENTAIEAYTERIKFGGAFSNFEQTTT